jgi:hypothetical protein
VEGDPISFEAVEILSDRDSRRIDGGAVLSCRYEAGTFDLRLTFGSYKGVPATLALTGCVLCVDDDSPVIAATADVALHRLTFSFSGRSTKGTCSRVLSSFSASSFMR